MKGSTKFVALWAFVWLCGTSHLLAAPSHTSEPSPSAIGEPASRLPGDSLYQLSIPLETQNSSVIPLTRFRGHLVLITLFYTQCTAVCPILTSTLQRLDRSLTAPERAEIAVIMVSLDAENDTPLVLSQFALDHHISDPRWVLARTGPAELRTLAATLGIRYRKLPDGSFNHTSVITLLDAQGVIVRQSSDLTHVDADLLKAIVAATRASTR